MMLKPNRRKAIPELTRIVAESCIPPKAAPTSPCVTSSALSSKIKRSRTSTPTPGNPLKAPPQLALVTIMQYIENLTDRQAADAVRARVDWKYALGLELTDPGFHYSVLSEFRSRLISAGDERTLLDTLLERCAEKGLLGGKSNQRTDSTHVLAAIRNLTLVELVGEAMRKTLVTIAVSARIGSRAGCLLSG